MLADLRTHGNPPGVGEREILGAWHGWGACPHLFNGSDFADERERVRAILGPTGWNAARRTVLNAHYTDPSIVQAMWGAVRALGVEAGPFLEPGAGRGSFISGAPDGFVGLGLELDPTTAEVAQHLVGGAHTVLARDVARVRLSRARAAVAIGNVPFGQYALYDPEFNPSLRLSIHDHFVAKGLASLAPGGVGIFVTSRYSLDRQDTIAREEMGRHANFLGAVRLPSSAHAAEAGTDVVTDILVFRARSVGAAPSHAPGFLERAQFLDADEERRLAVSTYFNRHPLQVLGEAAIASGPFGPQLVVRATGELAPVLTDALRRVVESAGQVPVRSTASPMELLHPRESLEAPIGRIERVDGVFRRYEVDGWTEHKAGKHASELHLLLGLRDQANDLVRLETSPDVGEGEVDERRAALRGAHAQYLDRYGPVNRVTVNLETDRRHYPAMGGFRTDPGWPRVAALERYDEATNTATPASLLVRRVVRAHQPIERVERPQDAITISLSERGRIDQALVASLLGTEVDAVADLLGDLAFEDPQTGALVDRAAYLSGNVRKKLTRAKVAASGDERFGRNVAALTAVQPQDVTADDLDGVLGAAWIGEEVVLEFARSLVRTRESRVQITVAHVQTTGEWIVDAPAWVRGQLEAEHLLGTPQMDALRILQFALNGRAPVVMTKADEKDVVDPDATAAAIEKAIDMRDSFDAWLLRADPKRAAAALRTYNDLLNAHVPRSYAGIAVTAPGLASDFRLRPHQEQAIARAIHSGNSAFWHPVGAGKTGEMVVTAFELKRLGLCERPCFVVPNNMLGQFASDIMALYPAAEVLVVDKDDVSEKNRALFAAKVRGHAWDAIVITHSSFTRWPVSPEIEEAELTGRVAELRTEAERLNALATDGASTKAVKQIERRIAAFEARQDKHVATLKQHRHSHEFYFDQSGIDLLFVDEADVFKNAEVHSIVRNLRGVYTGPGSQRALDLAMKLRALRQAGRDRDSTFATGTPISNTIAELYVFIRYQRPDLLEEVGICSFDDFRRQFGETESAMELDVTGSFRRVERLSRYKNLPELARLIGEFADIVKIEDLGLTRPELEGGKREVLLVEQSPQLSDFMTIEVTRRAEAIQARRVEPSEDNWLKLTGDLRLASFDWESFSGEPVDPEFSAIGRAARAIASAYHEHKHDRYLTPSGLEHPTPGSLQIVFADLSTPKPNRTDTAYDRLRRQLVDEGVPKDKIAFAHEYDKDDDEKARLQEMCRDGRTAVVVSSTPKFGVGTNVQDRAVAEWHLDVPYRPRDVEQREGRILRQGNQNEKVRIVVVATKASYSVYGWQMIERKAVAPGQILRLKLDGPRSIKVDDNEALNYGEIKNIVTGDPDFQRLAEAEEALTRLERLERSHRLEQRVLERHVEEAKGAAALAKRRAFSLESTADRVRAARHPERPWTVSVAGVTFTNRAEAARALLQRLHYDQSNLLAFPDTGISVSFQRAGQGDGCGTWTGNVGTPDVVIKIDERSETAVMGSLIRLTNAIERLPERHGEYLQRAQECSERATEAGARLGAPFARVEELSSAQARAQELQRVLADRYGSSDGRATEAESVQRPDEPSPVCTPTEAQAAIAEARRQLGPSSGASPYGRPRYGVGPAHQHGGPGLRA